MRARRRPAVITLSGVLALAALSAAGQESYASHKAKGPATHETIGVATQEPDGTIVLQLRTPDGSGVVGDALFRYPRTDPNFAAVARHVGPIPNGGSVFVRPFPD